jgi:hypothetical protein
VHTRGASADGYELNFTVNYLAHAQLIGDLLGSFVAPARIVLLGSNTDHANLVRRMMGVQPAQWRDPGCAHSSLKSSVAEVSVREAAAWLRGVGRR